MTKVISHRHSHTVVWVVHKLEKLYAMTKTVDMVQEDMLGPNKANFIDKVNYLKNLDVTTISDSSKNSKVELIEEILFDFMKVERKINMEDLRKFNSKFDFLLDYLQHVLRCVYFRLDNSERHLLMHYSPIATYSRTWNAFTRSSRGIIVDLQSNRLVVHPYDKFYNYREMPETQDANLPDLPYEDAEKLDGSEGILYLDSDDVTRIITKGGFYTTQGEFATKLMHEKYPQLAEDAMKEMMQKYTFTFEIIYANNDLNRIVVDYGSESDLKLIGVRDMFSGETLSYKAVQDMAIKIGVGAIKTETMTLDQMMSEKAKRKNYEGWVRRYSNGLYMKIKCDEYLEHHGARFGTSEKAVYNLIKEEKWDDFISNVPEEFKHVSEELYKKVVVFVIYKQVKIKEAYATIPQIESQKDFAIYVNTHIDAEFRGAMFVIRQGRDFNYLKEQTWSSFRDRMNTFYLKQNDN